tara:strand:+ start:1930 stop:2205 length:276 start_codon:yes stop_codon:yes gene_type:complete
MSGTGLKKYTDLRTAPPLYTNRYEEYDADDIDNSDTPLGWNELSDLEKKDILDFELDLYWKENSYKGNVWRLLFHVSILLNIYFYVSTYLN